MAILTLTAQKLTPGGLTPSNLTALMAGSPLSGNTGIKFVNTGKEIVVVQTNGTGSTTVTSDIGATVQGQAVANEQVTQALSLIQIYGPYPSQFDVQDGTNDVEIDFGTPANVAAVVVLQVGGVI